MKMTTEDKRKYVMLAVKTAYNHTDDLQNAIFMVEHMSDKAVEFMHFTIMRDLKTQPAENWNTVLIDAYSNPDSLPVYH